MATPTPIALTIAGLHPSGGAGVLADVRTFTWFGVRATAAITSLTFQNTTGVFGATHVSGKDVRAQVLPLLEEFKISGAKTGMLPTREVIQAVARLFRETDLPAPVVDPVMVSTSGHSLIEGDGVKALITELLPLARVVTPNIPEAEELTSMTIRSEAEMQLAAAAICGLGARAVLIKGGHLFQEPDGKRQEAREAIDILSENGRVTIFRSEFIPDTNAHGTGCRLSAGIAACLAKGMTLEDSTQAAKRFVFEEMRIAQS